jgi:exopolysaccharide production protein ExoQ
VLESGTTALPVPTARMAAFSRMLRPLEYVWAVVLLSIISGAYLQLLAPDGAGRAAAATRLAHMFLLPLYAVLGIIIVTHPNEFIRAAWRGKLGLGLVLLAGLSTLWSLDSGLTLARSISLLAPTAVGLMLPSRFTSRELIRILAVALGLAALCSVLVALALPDIGIESIEYGDAWLGVYSQKNDLGRAMALATAVFALLALEGSRYRWLLWLAAVGTFGVLLLARSATSLVVCVAVLALIPLLRSLRFRSATVVGLWILAVLVATIVLTVVVSNLEPTLALLGRDRTLTGRTDIWAAVMVSIAERPWLGYGYNAFWQEWSGPSAAVLSAVGWETPHSHNGVLDLWLDLGAVGIAVFITGLVVATRASVLRARHADTPADVWPLVFLAFLILINISESIVLKQHNLFWVLYVAILSAPRATSSRRRRVLSRGEAGAPLGPVSIGVRTAYRRRDLNG